jgi:predicted component of type VI protein secretion system
MSKLILYDDKGARIVEYPLSKERIWIGRRPDNDVHLNHPTVSGQHAMIITLRNDSFLEDLGSTNGTRVNKETVKKCALRDGDEIRVGRFRMKFLLGPVMQEEGGAWPDQVDPLSGEMLLPEIGMGEEGSRDQGNTQLLTTTLDYRSGSGKAQAPGAATPGKVLLAALQILSGPGTGNELLLEKTLTTLGKPGIQTVVITRRSEGYYFSLVDGIEPPLINGKPVSSTNAQQLHNRDIIELAGTKMEFYLK